MTNKEIQTFLQQFEDDIKIPDRLAIQIVQIGTQLIKEKINKRKRNESPSVIKHIEKTLSEGLEILK